jgi:aminopeptidase N
MYQKDCNYMRILFFVCLLFTATIVFAQRPIDVQHYKFEIELSDLSDVIVGKATIQAKFLQPSSTIIFDLISMKEEKGMKVFQVKEEGQPLIFIHKNNELEIRLKKHATANESRSFEIAYMGVPEDGLVISANKYGERTFFSDNWPNRAHNWIPCNDVPSDKSKVEFIVTAPIHYKVISNGLLKEEKKIANNLKRSWWKEDIAIPTKVMVIGAARFAVGRVDSNFHIPISSWVYPQDSIKGMRDYSLAQPIIQYFEGLVGPYPFKKLANVQSKTIFGGMENASAIFYAENRVTGTGSSEALIAHEIAHQWFGNTVTEKNFSHLWLSEGFATYLTHMYIEHKYGKDSFQQRLSDDRNKIIAFASKNAVPVVDSSADYMSLLNENSYQKGGWVLHMLREEVGDKNFRNILKAFYKEYGFANADTRDFQAVAEKVSGKDLKWFFDQWLYKPGVPELEIKVKVDGDDFKMKVEQGKDLYRLPLHFTIVKEDGETIHERLMLEERETEYKLKTKGPVRISIDKGLFIQK